MGKNVYIETLGCAKNQVDSEKMAALLEERGYAVVDDPSIAEFIIVNTCGFIQSAKEEAIDVLFEMTAYKESGVCKKIIAAGCFAERYTEAVSEEFSRDEVDVVFGIGDISKIVDALESTERIIKPEKSDDLLFKRKVKGFPGSAYLRISDGCSNHCAYCAIPIIRGELRSRSIEDIMKELEGLLANDVKEITVISQDTTNFGMDRTGRRMLAELLKTIDSKLADGQWLRTLYMHPDHITEEFLTELTKLNHFLPYFDIPFQSGSATILKKMGRAGSLDKYLALLKMIRSYFPMAVIRSTIITGFPGETKEEYQETLRFIADAGIDWLGVFIYSPEEGTRAADLPGRISDRSATARKNQILKTGEMVSEVRLQRFVGLKTNILIEERVDDELYLGRFWGQAPEVDGVTVVEAFNAEPGQFILAEIKKLNGKDFFATGL